ncbi:MAG: response regulator [Gemmatimonadetes bacterium]|nr:response regulator [Gemmatimonadota bacterium]MCC6770706.1 response regulator [Gemmatimonadaceae bacterium]
MRVTPFTSAGLRRRSSVLLALVTASAVLALVGLAEHPSWRPETQAWLAVAYTPIYPLSALLCVLAAMRSGDATSRRTWLWFAGASSVMLVTAFLYWAPRAFGAESSSVPSDVLAGVRQLCIAGAIIGLTPRDERREGRTAFQLDVAIVVGAAVLVALKLWDGRPPAGSVGALLPASPTYLVVAAASSAVAFVALSYFAVRSQGVPSGRPLRLALYATVPTIIVDLMSSVAPLRWADLVAPTTLLSTATLALAAAWHVRAPAAVRLAPRARNARAHNVAPYLALAAVELFILIDASQREALSTRLMLLGIGLLIALLVARQYLTVRENIAHVRARALEQERLVHLAQNSSDAAVLVAADGTIRFDLPILPRLLGVEARTLVGRSILALLVPDDRARLGHILNDLQPGKTAAPLTVRGAASSGRLRSLEVVAANHAHVPALDGIVLNIRDVTDRAQLEEQLRDSQKLEGIGRLAGGVAHDFNNLLTAIISNCELLETDPSITGDVAEEVRDIRRAADRAADLTRQLLQFARRQIVAPGVLTLETVLAQTERLLKRVLTEHIVLAISVRDGPLRITADPTQLDQVLLNLVVNARDAMPHGGRLTISARRRQLTAANGRVAGALAPGRYVEVRVADTGEGMTDDVQARIFEPFFTTKDVGAGTGLGLATSYGIVRQLGGDILVQSVVGGGTTFTLLIPETDAAIETSTLGLPKFDDRVRETPRVSPPVSRRRLGTVLVAEDESSVRALAVRALRERGFEVLPAVDGADALRLARAHTGPIDLLVSDLVMPHVGGVQLAITLRAMGHASGVLFITGYAEGEQLDRISEVRGAEVLLKPFAPSALLARVAQLDDQQVGA